MSSLFRVASSSPSTLHRPHPTPTASGTALHLAVLNGKELCVRRLLANRVASASINKHGSIRRGPAPDVNKPDDQGRTPLMACAAAGRDSIALLLLKAGAATEARDNGGLSALDLASTPMTANIPAGQMSVFNARERLANIGTRTTSLGVREAELQLGLGPKRRVRRGRRRPPGLKRELPP